MFILLDRILYKEWLAVVEFTGKSELHGCYCSQGIRKWGMRGFTWEVEEKMKERCNQEIFRR